MIKVSIIVPVYNVEKYLQRCLDSLINQGDDIEVIIINDGSTDNSHRIISEYTNKYPFMISFNKENEGCISAPRNLGLDKAKGEYILFVDSDDWLEPNTIPSLYKKAKSDDFDMVVFDVKLVDDNNNTTIVTSSVNRDINKDNDIRHLYIDFYPVAVNKLYKASLLKNIRFKNKIWYEDVEFIYRLLPDIKRVGVIHEAYYNYYQRPGSFTKTFNEHLYDYIDNLNGIILDYKKKNIYNKYKKELEYFYLRYMYATFIKGATHYSKEEFKKCVELAINNVKQHFPHYRTNKYFYQSKKGFYLLLFNRLLANILYNMYQNRR